MAKAQNSMLSQGKKGEGGHSETSKASQTGFISVTARAEVPALWNDWMNELLGCVVVSGFFVCAFLTVLQV